MQSSKAKKWLIMVGVYLSLLTLMFVPEGLVYTLPLLLAAIFYDRNRFGFWSGLILVTPFVVGVAAQFGIRLFSAFAHGGEAPNGDGSPMAFLIGFALEMPFYILLVCLLVAWTGDYRRSRALPAEAEIPAEDRAA